MTDQFSLTAGGVTYTGFPDGLVSRGLDRCASHFELTVPERFLAGPTPLPLAQYTPVVIRSAGTLMLTGYIDQYDVSFGLSEHTSKIAGRSKTAQLVDCTPDIQSGQYQGYTMAAIAQSVCAIFGITCKVQTDLANVALADSTLERGETAFTFLDRLATLCGVLLCDDETGALVLTMAGATRATGRLVQGVDGGIVAARLTMDGERRFSTYILKGQSGIKVAAGASNWDALDGGGDDDSDTSDQTTPQTAEVETQQRAVANDPGVPLYRPKVIIAEAQLDQAQLQIRANWQRSYAYGQSLKATATVNGWRQPDGTLWQVNQLVPVTSPFLGADEDLLELGVDWRFSMNDGPTTEITVGPVEGAIPSPSLLKRTRRKKRRKGRASVDWSALSGVSDGGASTADIGTTIT